MELPACSWPPPDARRHKACLCPPPFNVTPGTPALTYSETLLWGAHGICSHLARPPMPETLFWQPLLPFTLPTCVRQGGIKNSVHNIYWSHLEVKSALALWSMHVQKDEWSHQNNSKKKKKIQWFLSTVAWFFQHLKLIMWHNVHRHPQNKGRQVGKGLRRKWVRVMRPGVALPWFINTEKRFWVKILCQIMEIW